MRSLRRAEFEADQYAFLERAEADRHAERELDELWRDHWGELFERHRAERRGVFRRNVGANVRQMERDFGMRVQTSGWGFP
jgi:hypothetical protein